MTSIHTLNARGNILLPAMRDSFAWSDAKAFLEIQRFHQDFLAILKLKGIVYSDLRTALVPQSTKHEAAFLFDMQRCRSIFPGADAADALFQLLPSATTHSILGGELMGEASLAQSLLGRTVIIAKDLNFAHPCYCYVLYVNNLSEGTIASIHKGLQEHPGYLGYLPCTYGSLAKTYVVMGLVNLAIKQKNTVILGHEDDRDNRENRNLHVHDYAALGLQIRSIQSLYFGVFLSYKPERMLLESSDDDLEIAIRAISSDIVPLHTFSVVIQDEKYEYLIDRKLGKLRRAGLVEISKSELERAIQSKIRSNYLYNLKWRSEPDFHGSFFNVMLEFSCVGREPERVTVALEYIPSTTNLRLITFT